MRPGSLGLLDPEPALAAPSPLLMRSSSSVESLHTASGLRPAPPLAEICTVPVALLGKSDRLVRPRKRKERQLAADF